MGLPKRTRAVFGIINITLLAVVIGGCQPQNTLTVEGEKSNIVLVSDDEPGQPLIVSGTLYSPDGKTPVSGASIYVYHTDNDGKYNWLGLRRPLGMPRIKGTMITDSRGRYQFRSIKPAPYPKKKRKPHVHYKVQVDGYPEQKFKLSIDEEAHPDPSGFNESRRLKLDGNGVFHATLNLRLDKHHFSSSQ